MAESSAAPEPEAPKDGRTPPYTFTQTLRDVTVTMPKPDVRARDLIIKFTPSHLFVSHKGLEQPIVDYDLFATIKAEDSTWLIDDGQLVIELAKVNQQEWWKCVCQGDAEIDTSKIQPEDAKLSDLEPETRAMVEKMMFDQRQKQMGLPTSEEMEKQQMLQKFMKDHPEMDFSQAKFG